MNKPVTLWHVFDKKRQRWDFNHLENGHAPYDQQKPLPHSDAQNWWPDKTWMKWHKYLNPKGKVVDRE
jgi:hypothetical protein